MPLNNMLPGMDSKLDPSACPDRVGKRCANYQAPAGCALDTHPCCELWVSKNPGRPTGSKSIDAFLAKWTRYRDDIKTGQWFTKGWTLTARSMLEVDAAASKGDVVGTFAAMGTLESSELDAPIRKSFAISEKNDQGQLVDLATREPLDTVELARQTPDRLTIINRGRFRRFALRTAKADELYPCAACHEHIKPGEDFYDGEAAELRAHQRCVAGAPVHIAVVGAPSDRDIEDMIAANKTIMIDSPEFGRVWVVPEYTNSGRNEWSWKHFQTLCMMLNRFPGARIGRMANVQPGEVAGDPGPWVARCICLPDDKDAKCPVGLAHGNHGVGDHAKLECECEDEWDNEKRRRDCKVGRAYGAHGPAPSRE